MIRPLPVYESLRSFPSFSSSCRVAEDGSVFVWGRLMNGEPRESAGQSVAADVASQAAARGARSRTDIAAVVRPTATWDALRPRRVDSLPVRASRVACGQAHVAILAGVCGAKGGEKGREEERRREEKRRKFTSCSVSTACFVRRTEDGSVWFTGMRGRGAQFDSTFDLAAESDGADVNAGAAETRNSSHPASAPAASSTASSAESSAESATGVIGAEDTWVEKDAVAIASLAELRAAALSSPTTQSSATSVPVGLTCGLHHAYVTFDSGDVVRVGWRGKPEPVLPLAGLRVRDLSVGFTHAIALVDDGASPPELAPAEDDETLERFWVT